MGLFSTLLERLRRRAPRSRVRGFLSSPSGRTPSAPTITYAAEIDGQPDAGEVVWGWVPYEEDASQGKDRPVLLLGHHDGQWVGLMLSSQDHTNPRDAEREARHGRHWMDVGTGAWDRERRPSEVRLDRLIRLDDAAIRREGAAMDRAVFDRVAAQARLFHTFA